MNKYSKYIISFLLAVISYFIADFVIIELSKSPNGTSTDFGFIQTGIVLIISLIIGCTALIIASIKEISKK